MRHHKSCRLYCFPIIILVTAISHARSELVPFSERESEPNYVINVVRDLPPSGNGVHGRFHSLVAEVHDDSTRLRPEVLLSAFIHVGCVELNNTNTSARALASCTSLNGYGSRINCTKWCGELVSTNNYGASAVALINRTNCYCCASDDVLASSVFSPAACDQLCEDRERSLYGNLPFSSQPSSNETIMCGGRREFVFSAFREHDGVSPLGRRGAFSAAFATWYEAAVLQLPTSHPDTIPLQGQRWTTYGSFLYFLHAVHVDTGWPVFAHQQLLPFAPECLQVDGLRGHVLALARTWAGGLDVVKICPGCTSGFGAGKQHFELISVFNESSGPSFVAVMPACVFDAGKALFKFTARSMASASYPHGDGVQLVEVDVSNHVVVWRRAAALANAISLEQCTSPSGDTDRLSAVVASPKKQFVVTSQDSSERGDAGETVEALPECKPNMEATRCTNPGPPAWYVQMSASAAHASLPFMFVPTEAAAPANDFNSTGDNMSARLAQLRCDESGSDVVLWPDAIALYHRRRGAMLESPFSRFGGSGHPVPTPRLLRAEFSSSGRKILLTFDVRTLMGAVPQDTNGDGLADSHDSNTAWPHIFRCSLLLSSDTVRTLGFNDTTGECLWASASEVIVRLGPSHDAQIGDRVALRSGMIYSYVPQRGYSAPANGAVFLAPPVKVRQPQIMVHGAREVDYCSDIYLDASASTDDTGKLQVFWEVVAATCRLPSNNFAQSACGQNASQMYDAIVATNASGSRILRLGASQRPPNLIALEVEVKIVSPWGLEDRERIIVHIFVNGLRPTVDIVAIPSATTPSRGVELRGQAWHSLCDRTAKLTFNWELASIHPSPLVSNNAAADMLIARAWSLWNARDSRGWASTSLLVPPFALAAGAVYQFRFTATPLILQVSPLFYEASSTYVNVSVSPSPLNLRFVQPLLMVSPNSFVDVDVRPSYDPDRPDDVLPRARWRCEEVTEGACPLEFLNALVDPGPCEGEPSSENLSYACRPTSSSLRVGGGLLFANSHVRLVATVEADVVDHASQWWLTTGLLKRSAEATSELVVAADDSRRLQTSTSGGQAQSLSAWVLPLHRATIGSHESLRIEGFGAKRDAVTVVGIRPGELTANLSYDWRVERLDANPLWSYDVAKFDGTAYSVPRELYTEVPSAQSEPVKTTSDYGSSLAFQPYALLPGARYRFVLSVRDYDLASASEAIGAAEVEIVQSRPLLGHFAASPGHGFAWSTVFKLSCEGWAAEEGIPLLYDFGYSPDFSSMSPVELRLGARMTSAQLFTRDVGTGIEGSQVQVFVDVYTSLGGKERAVAFLDVRPNLNFTEISDELMQASLGSPAQTIFRLPAIVLSSNHVLEDPPARRHSSSGGDQEIEPNLMIALETWRTAASFMLGLTESVPVGVPPWPLPSMGLDLVAILGAWRIIMSQLSVTFQRLSLGIAALNPLLAIALPSAELERLRRAGLPGRFPEVLLSPEAPLTEVLLRAISDLLIAKEPLANYTGGFASDLAPQDMYLDGDGSANDSADNGRNVSIVTNEMLSSLFKTLESIYVALLPRLVQTEFFSLVMPGFAFFAGRDSVVQNPHALVSLEVAALVDVWNPTGWLFVNLGHRPLFGHPANTSLNVTRIDIEGWRDTSFTVTLPSVALVSISDSFGVAREAQASMFGSHWRALSESPAASCFQWVQDVVDGQWTQSGLVADEEGGCRISVGKQKTSAVVGLFADLATFELGMIDSGTELMLLPPQLKGLPQVAVAFTTVVGLVAMRALATLFGRRCAKRAKPIQPAVAPLTTTLHAGYRAARVVDDALRYASHIHRLGFHGVCVWRSWLQISQRAHLFIGLYTSDQKVTFMQKLCAVIATLSAASGFAAVLYIRARFLPIMCTVLCAMFAWVLGVCSRLLYECRLWFIPEEDSEVSNWQRWYDAEDAINALTESLGTTKTRPLPASTINFVSVTPTPDDNVELTNVEPIARNIVDDAVASIAAEDAEMRRIPSDEIVNAAVAAGASAADPTELRSTLLQTVPEVETLSQLPPGFKLNSVSEEVESIWLKKQPSYRTARPMPRARSPPRAHRKSGLSRDSTFSDGKSTLRSGPLHDQVPRLTPLELHGGASDTIEAMQQLDELIARRKLSAVSAYSGSRSLNTTVSSSAKALDSVMQTTPRHSALSAAIASRLSMDRTPAGCHSTSRHLPILRLSELPPLPERPHSDDLGQRVTSSVAELMARHLQQPLYSTRRFLQDLHYEELALARVRRQLHGIEALHVSGLQTPHVEQSREDLPEYVVHVFTTLAHIAAFSMTWMGCAVTALYQEWIFQSIRSAIDFFVVVSCTWILICLLDFLRTGLMTLHELARLETHRLSNQGDWFREHLEAHAHRVDQERSCGELFAPPASASTGAKRDELVGNSSSSLSPSPLPDVPNGDTMALDSPIVGTSAPSATPPSLPHGGTGNVRPGSNLTPSGTGSFYRNEATTALNSRRVFPLVPSPTLANSRPDRPDDHTSEHQQWAWHRGQSNARDDTVEYARRTHVTTPSNTSVFSQGVAVVPVPGDIQTSSYVETESAQTAFAETQHSRYSRQRFDQDRWAWPV